MRQIITLHRMFIRPIPVFAIQFLLARSIAGISRNHPRIFARLGKHAKKIFLIDPVDMPFVFVLRPNPERPTLEARRSGCSIWDAKISGRFINLLKLMEARMDGDALFFSRSLVVEGDTEAVVCLRNALDDMDSNIIDEAAKAFGIPGIVGLRLARTLEELHHAFVR